MKLRIENRSDVKRMKCGSYALAPLVSMILVFVGISGESVAFAQSSATGSRSISVGVSSGWLSVYVNKPLDFGTVLSGSGNHSVAVTDANAGKVTIYGIRFFPVYVTLTPPSSLMNGSGTDSLAYSPSAAYNNTADNPSGATQWSNPSGLQSGFYLQANSTLFYGYAYVYLYGTINVSKVPAGTYSGTYTVSVTYF